VDDGRFTQITALNKMKYMVLNILRHIYSPFEYY